MKYIIVRFSLNFVHQWHETNTHETIQITIYFLTPRSKLDTPSLRSPHPALPPQCYQTSSPYDHLSFVSKNPNSRPIHFQIPLLSIRPMSFVSARAALHQIQSTAACCRPT